MKVSHTKTSIITFENRKELAAYFMPYITAPYNNFRVYDSGKKAVRELLKLALPPFVSIQYITNGYGQLVKVAYDGQEIAGKTALLNALNVIKFPYQITVTN